MNKVTSLLELEVACGVPLAFVDNQFGPGAGNGRG
jgi:hypothetical protein